MVNDYSIIHKEDAKVLRTLSQSDIPAMLVIENAVHIAPWSKETFQACFQAGYKGWVLEMESKMMGFIMISQTVDACHILNLCVMRECQHLGWGTTLLTHCLNYAKEQGLAIVYLEVRCSNTKAISLYKKMKFQQIGMRSSYYPTVNGYEDALIFALSLI